MIISATRCPVLFPSFSAALNVFVSPDKGVSLYIYICGSDSRIIIKCSMNCSMTVKCSVAILAFNFCSRVLFCVKHGITTVLSMDNCRLAQWAMCSMLIDVIDDVNESLQPYFRNHSNIILIIIYFVFGL